MRTHEQTYVPMIMPMQDYAHTGFYPETLETQQTNKTSKQKF